MKASELLAAARDDYLDDKASDDTKRLWRDASVLRRLNQAQREAANRALLLRDQDTPRICEITLVAGQADYALDTRIIKVNRIDLQWPDGRLTQLPALSSGEMALQFGADWETAAGQPLAYRPEGHAIRLARVPTEEYTGLKLKLDVYRYPLALLVAGFSSSLAASAVEGATSVTLHTGDGALLPPIGVGQELSLTCGAVTITATGRAGDVLTCLPLSAGLSSAAVVTADNEPEIPASQHEDLLYWVAGHAFLKRDTDIEGNKGSAATLLGLFAQAFGPPIDHSKRMHNLHSTSRIQLGGIQYPMFGRGAGRRGAFCDGRQVRGGKTCAGISASLTK